MGQINSDQQYALNSGSLNVNSKLSKVRKNLHAEGPINQVGTMNSANMGSQNPVHG